MANPIWNPTAAQPYSFMKPVAETNALPFSTVPTSALPPAPAPAPSRNWMGIVGIGAALIGACYFMGVFKSKSSRNDDDGFAGAFESTPKRRKGRRKTRKSISRRTARKMSRRTRRTTRKGRGRVTGHI